MLEISTLIVFLIALSFSSVHRYTRAVEEEGEMKQNEDTGVMEQIEPVAIVEYNSESGRKLPDVSPDNKYEFIRIFSGLYYQKTYKLINNFLVDNVDCHADAAANLRAATQFREIVRQESRWYNLYNKNLLGALEQFILLNRILRGEKCTRNSYAILLKNDRATRGRSHQVQSKLGLLLRIERVIRQIAMDHALECKKKYPQFFEQKYAQLDKAIVEKVEAFTSNIINQLMRKKKNIFSQKKRFETPEQLQYIKTINGQKEGQIAYNALKLFARKDRDVVYLRKVVDEKEAILKINRVKLVELFEKYLAEPCAYYVRELGPSIFIPASYDIMMFEKEDRYVQDDDNANFLSGWIRYKICNLLIGKDKKSLIRSVVSIAIREP